MTVTTRVMIVTLVLDFGIVGVLKLGKLVIKLMIGRSTLGHALVLGHMIEIN